MSITIVNPQCGEAVFTINNAVVCNTLPDHAHCKPETCPEQGFHGNVLNDDTLHCIIERGPERTAALQVQKIEIRKFTFTETTREPVVGQVDYIEARGLIAIEDCPTKVDPEVCARSTHRHVKVKADAYAIEQGAAPGSEIECCVISNYYPVTLHMTLPVGDGCQPFLGDNLIISVRRAYGRLEHQYRIE